MPEAAANEKPRLITISTVTIVKVVLFALLLGFAWMIRDIIALFFVALMLSTIINPLASWFESLRVPRAAGVLLLYAGILGLLLVIATTLVPAVARETRDLLGNADAIWASLLETLGPARDFVAGQGLSDSLGRMTGEFVGGGGAGSLVSTIRGFFGGVAGLIIVLVVTFYMVVSEDAVRRLFRNVAPEAYQPYLIDLFGRIEKAIGAWVRGQLILSLIVAVAVYLALTILGVKYALVLALVAGVAESIPYLGPVFSAIPAVLVALTQSPLKALLVLLMYWVIQLAENHVLVPKVMQKATGLHPIVSIFSLLIGAKLAGLVGALLAIPVATAASIAIGDAFRLMKSNR